MWPRGKRSRRDDDRLRFTPSDRAFLAAVPHRLPPEVVRRFRLLVRPDTIVRRHRDLIARPARRQVQAKAGRPPADGAFHPGNGLASGPTAPSQST
jgi:hypothetical protein